MSSLVAYNLRSKKKETMQPPFSVHKTKTVNGKYKYRITSGSASGVRMSLTASEATAKAFAKKHNLTMQIAPAKKGKSMTCKAIAERAHNQCVATRKKKREQAALGRAPRKASKKASATKKAPTAKRTMKEFVKAKKPTDGKARIYNSSTNRWILDNAANRKKLGMRKAPKGKKCPGGRSVSM